MASGQVRKKIALFEIKDPNTEQHCRLKRKHAIRRKKYQRDRKRSSDSMIPYGISEEYINRFEDSSSKLSPFEVKSSFSASCSALLDLIYNPDKSNSLVLSTPQKNHQDNQDKRILCRTSSLEEAVPSRLNIVDIDIEVRVGKRNSSQDLYEPVEALIANALNKIKLSHTMDSNSSYSGNVLNPNSIPASSNPSNYYCTGCGNYNTNTDTLNEHMYENFSLIPPPRPPKRFFGGSLSSNYNYTCNASYSDLSTNGNQEMSSLTCENRPKVQEISDNDPIKTAAHENEDEEKEPYYEDLYDYCNPPNECCSEEIQPVAVTSFVSGDKEEEVEYCDCSTVMAMTIDSLDRVQTVFHKDFSKEKLPFLPATENNNEKFKTEDFGNRKTKYVGNPMRNELKSVKNLATHIRSNSLTSLIKDREEYTLNKSKGDPVSDEMLYKGRSLSRSLQEEEKNETVQLLFLEKLKTYRFGDETNKHLTIDSYNKDKKDDDDLNKPLPTIPKSASGSCSSSDSFYSEPLYGITNRITNKVSNLKNPGPPVPDTLRRPSLSLNPNSNVISCNNVIRSPPAQLSLFKKNKNHPPSISSGHNATYDSKGYGYTTNNDIDDYADSISTLKLNPNACNSSIYDSSVGFVPTDKLPPIPPSKFSSIAKSAGRKIAKKFLGRRKTSKSSLENYDVPSSSASSTNGSLSGCPSRVSNPSLKSVERIGAPTQVIPIATNTQTVGVITQNPQIKKLISRPSIPPPEPPKILYGGSSNGSGNNYSIDEKSSPVNGQNDHMNEDDDDFDDSDFYDSDSELIRNFVSQVQPIYSMEEEPLYQYYAYGISTKPEDDYQPVIPKNLGLTLDMLVPRGGQRTLWCELSEVLASGILGILSDKQKQLQEAIFEILTSEVSYLKSLDVLISVFYKNQELIGVLTEEERGFVFGNIEKVRECAQSFLAELLSKWDESWYIQDIGEIIDRNTNTRFTVYKEYCRNKPYQDKAMQRLRHSRDEFVNVIKTLEEDSKCQMLRIDSFLMLPMQRITRLPLLVNAVIQRTTSVKEKSLCEEALKSLTNLVLSCNEAARESQDAEETSSILEKLEFPRGTRPVPLGQFVMKGDFIKNPFEQGKGNQMNWTFRKNKRTFYWILLFTNQLLITKRKVNGRFEVLDQSAPEDCNIKPLPNLEGVSNDFQNFFMLHFNKKETVYFLASRTNSEVERWKAKLDSFEAKKTFQVEAIFPYESRRTDELSFQHGDAIEVSQMQPDGWYYGTKVNGRQSGWFPGNYCCEVLPRLKY